MSDPTTKKFDILHPTFGGNRAGECYDCYYGTLNWTSNVVHTQKNGASPLPLRMGVFPMERFLSHCSYQHVQSTLPVLRMFRKISFLLSSNTLLRVLQN